jgi:hypothetical protein
VVKKNQEKAKQAKNKLLKNQSINKQTNVHE